MGGRVFDARKCLNRPVNSLAPELRFWSVVRETLFRDPSRNLTAKREFRGRRSRTGVRERERTGVRERGKFACESLAYGSYYKGDAGEAVARPWRHRDGRGDVLDAVGAIGTCVAAVVAIMADPRNPPDP